MPPIRPPLDVKRAFGAVGVARRFASGEGSAFRVGDLVLKPTPDAREAEWIADVLEAVVEKGYRVARPVRASDDLWVHDGWTAWQYVSGRSTTREWKEVVAAGVAFHGALRGTAKPTFLGERSHQWAVGDRVAFGEQEAPVAAPIAVQVAHLAALLEEVRLPSQVIHGDLTENVLIDEDLPPAIIDFSPYYRPTGYGTAIIVVDALVGHGAPTSLIDLVQPAGARYELIARALIFRLVAAALAPNRTPARVELQARAYAGLVDLVARELRAS